MATLVIPLKKRKSRSVQSVIKLHLSFRKKHLPREECEFIPITIQSHPHFCPCGIHNWWRLKIVCPRYRFKIAWRWFGVLLGSSGLFSGAIGWLFLGRGKIPQNFPPSLRNSLPKIHHFQFVLFSPKVSGTKNGGTKPCKAFPLHKPYPYSLYRWVPPFCVPEMFGDVSFLWIVCSLRMSTPSNAAAASQRGVSSSTFHGVFCRGLQYEINHKTSLFLGLSPFPVVVANDGL